MRPSKRELRMLVRVRPCKPIHYDPSIQPWCLLRAELVLRGASHRAICQRRCGGDRSLRGSRLCLAHCILKWLSGHRSHQFRRQLRLHRFLLHWLVIVYHSCVALLQHHTLPRPLSSLIQVGCLQNGAVLVQLDRCTTVRDHRILSR